jgi:plastocyanin
MAILAVLAAVAVVGVEVASAAQTVTTEATDYQWTPADIHIQADDTVRWTNAEGFHNVVLDGVRLNDPGFPDDPSWSSPVERTFTTPGEHTFFCEIHEGMTGTITVTGGTPTPTPTTTPTPTPTPTQTQTQTPTPTPTTTPTPTPTQTVEPTPTPIPSPGADRDSDHTPPVLGNVTVTGGTGTVSVGFTLSETATVNARFVPAGGDVIVPTYRAEARAGTSGFQHSLAKGTYTVELTAVDAMGNRSSTYTSEVRIRG